MRWRRLLRSQKLLVLAILFVAVLAPEWPAFGDEAYRLDALVGLRQYDFLVWELQALAAKFEAILAKDHSYLDDSAQRQLVQDYLAIIDEMNRLDGQIAQFYINPDIDAPDLASADLQNELAEQRALFTQIQPFAEAIVQDQVAEALQSERFTLLGQTWPPVMMHMTPLPTILMVSPRDRIERVYGIPLVHGLSIPEREALETAVFEQLNLSALVVPIGGLGLYPSMIMQSGNINWLAEVTAHEWAHVWMVPYPISLYYASDQQVRTMNETTASIIGSEIGAQVIAQYYPDRLPTSPNLPLEEPSPAPDAPPPFNFRAEMAETRVQADGLLAKGRIEEAESYMEMRRQLFVANGFQIRKLNQAYFAFYGAYADEPGAAGADPVGPLVQEVRTFSPSLHAFMETMVPISSFEELQEVVANLKTES